MIHSPSDFPEVTKKGISVGVGQETNIAVSAMVTLA